MSAEQLRGYVLVLVRDFLIPVGGLFVTIDLMLRGTLEPWHFPLLAGMLGTPLVARSASKRLTRKDDEEDDDS